MMATLILLGIVFLGWQIRVSRSKTCTVEASVASTQESPLSELLGPYAVFTSSNNNNNSYYVWNLE
jgi:hypothetical protein